MESRRIKQCSVMAEPLIFTRINLSKTNYSQLDNCGLIEYPDIAQLNNIYQQYCVYKKFNSVRPLFKNEYYDENTEILGYMHNNKLVAFSLIKLLDEENIEAVQFAWDYQNPELRLGILSLHHECAHYKNRGYKYMHLGLVDDYKQTIDGFEILGPL